MKSDDAVAAFSALAQGTRLDVFRLLLQHEPGGLPAGEVANRVGVPHNTLSSHLRVLSHAGLVTAARRSRTITYRAAVPRLAALVAFLVEDCCGGDPALCAPLLDNLVRCAPNVCEPSPGRGAPTRGVAAEDPS